MKNVNRLKRAEYGAGYADTGANPDFRVTSATRNAAYMDHLLKKLSMQSKVMDRKMQALDLLQQVRERVKEPDVVLVEEVDAGATKIEEAN